MHVGLPFTKGTDAPKDYQRAEVWAGIDSYILIGARFDASVLRRLLPCGIEPVDGSSGGMIIYESTRNVGAPAFSAVKAWVDIRGHDTPEGVAGRFILQGYYSPAMAAELNMRAAACSISGGWSQQRTTGSIVEGEGGPAGKLRARAAIRRGGRPGQYCSYYHYYVGIDADGSTEVVPISVSNEMEAAVPLDFHLELPVEGTTMELLPTELLWAANPTKAVIAPGPTIRASTFWAEHDRRASALRSLERMLWGIGRPAMIVDGDMHVLAANAHPLPRSLVVVRGRVQVASAHQAAFEQMLHTAIGAPTMAASAEPLFLPQDDDPRPVIVQVLPIGPLSADSVDFVVRGSRLALVLVQNLAARSDPPLRALERLGLTPAEARLAARVASGMSPAVAARALGIAMSTARTTLSIVYSKLAIGRQSELALLVARLEASAGSLPAPVT